MFCYKVPGPPTEEVEQRGGANTIVDGRWNCIAGGWNV